MALRIPWDKKETAILIEAYLRVKNKELSQQKCGKRSFYTSQASSSSIWH